ncbi:MAG: hypothetical protein ABIH23_32015 [bacterium]
MKEFPPSIPRKMYWSSDVGGFQRCPRCGGALTSAYQTYVMGVRDGDETAMLITGTDGGHFCEKCPVVVLDSDVFANLAQAGVLSDGAVEFAVPGIVDMEAIPEEKRGIPLGEDDNPIPLVEFTNHPEGKPRRRAESKSRGKRRHSSARKRKRKRR